MTTADTSASPTLPCDSDCGGAGGAVMTALLVDRMPTMPVPPGVVVAGGGSDAEVGPNSGSSSPVSSSSASSSTPTHSMKAKRNSLKVICTCDNLQSIKLAIAP